MKFSLGDKSHYKKENISTVFRESDSSSSEEESKPKRPRNTNDNSELIEKHKKEGILQAEIGNMESALKSFDEATLLSSSDSSIFEMKAQVLLSMNQVFPAIRAAHTSVRLSPLWSTAYQTLGRAQLGKGEVELALKNFEKCLHLDPGNTEVWTEDLPWCRELVNQKINLEMKVKFHSQRALKMDAKD